jgi:hypothetical protein
MKIILEATDITQDFIIDLYKAKVRIIDAVESPNGWIDITLEGSEINLLQVYAIHWCEPAVKNCVEDFKHQIFK